MLTQQDENVKEVIVLSSGQDDVNYEWLEEGLEDVLAVLHYQPSPNNNATGKTPHGMSSAVLSEMDDPQSPLLRSFRSSWLGEQPSPVNEDCKNLHGKSLVKSLTATFTSTVSQKHPPPTRSKPRNKAEAMGEVSMLLEARLVQDFPSITAELQDVFGLLGEASVPQIVVIEDGQSFEGCSSVVKWQRKLPCSGEKVECPFECFVVLSLEDFFKFKESFLTSCSSTKKKTFLVVPGMRQWISQKRAAINKKIRRNITKSRSSKDDDLMDFAGGDLATEDAKWAGFEDELFRKCMTKGIYLLTSLNRYGEASEHLGHLLAELTKSIAWVPYHGQGHAGLKFAADRLSGRKAADAPGCIWRSWLEEIPRLPSASIDAIIMKWPTYASFMKDFKAQEDTSVAINSVAALRTSSNVRSVGQVAARRICEHFLNRKINEYL